MPPKDEEEKVENLKVTFEGGTFKMGNDSWVPSEGVETAGTTPVFDPSGTGTVDSLDPGMEMSYSFGELDNQMSFDYEPELRKKYPALKQAYEHYQNVKQMCETREKEEDAN